jgi:plastocyanin
MRGGFGVLKQRGIVAALVAVAGTAAVGVAAAAGSSAKATDVTIYAVEDAGTYCFSTSPTTCNGNLQVAVNGATNKVTWAFQGPYTAPHNAKSTSDNWTYRSHDPSTSTDPADIVDPDYDFTTNGTYTFHCDAHAFMQGTITVTGAAEPTSTATSTATATPTPSTQPSDPNTNTPPPTGGTADAVKPTLRSIGASAKGRAVKVKFRLSESATVTIRVKRGSKLVKSVTKQLAAGNRSVSVRSAKKLKKGRYKIEVRARDASGNVSTLASKSFRIKP